MDKLFNRKLIENRTVCVVPDLERANPVFK